MLCWIEDLYINLHESYSALLMYRFEKAQLIAQQAEGVKPVVPEPKLPLEQVSIILPPP